jgi:basic membrane protein A
MKNFPKALLLFAVLMMVIIWACNKNDDEPQEQTCKVAMLAEGNTFDDMSFLQSCKEGMERARNEFNLQVEYNIDTLTNNYQERIDAYGARDFDLIIAIGYMWNEAVINGAKNYPQSKFVIVDTELDEAQDNAVSILFDVDEASYPLGFLSAWWADTHDGSNPKVGYVGALPIPQIRQFIEPFNNGILRYNQQFEKNVDTLGCYAGVFFDQELGKHLADSLITIGADVIFGVGSETGNGSLLGAKENGKCGVGVDVDQYYSFPEVSDILLSSAMKRLDNAIYEVVKSFVNNSFNGGGIYTGNLSNDGVETAPYHDYESQIPDSIKNETENIRQGIINGSISTGW